MLHLPRFLRRSTEKENTTGQSVQPVDCPQVLQIVFLRQNEDYRVVSVSSARVHLQFQDRLGLFAEKTEREAEKRTRKIEDCAIGRVTRYG